MLFSCCGLVISSSVGSLSGKGGFEKTVSKILLTLPENSVLLLLHDCSLWTQSEMLLLMVETGHRASWLVRVGF